LKEKQAFENSAENKDRRDTELKLKKAELNLKVAEAKRTEEEVKLKTLEMTQKR